MFGGRGQDLYLFRQDSRTIAVVDTRTGSLRRDIPVQLDANDVVRGMSLSPDGKRFLLTTGGLRYDLWLAEGFAQPAKGWKSWFHHWEIPPAPRDTETSEFPKN